MTVLSTLFVVALTFLPPAPSETVLLPVSPGAIVNGANDSHWAAELTVYNSGSYAVTLAALVTRCPPFECLGTLVIEPGTSSVVPVEEGINDPPASRLIYAVPDARNIHFNLRAVSFPQTAPGASVPVVRQDETFTSTVHLIGIPVGPALRSSVRVYDLAPEQGSSTVALIRIFDSTEGQNRLIATLPLELVPHQEAFAPGYGSLHNLQEFIGGDVTRFRVEVDPPPGKAVWAFVATVESSTESVLITAPSARCVAANP